MKNRGPVRLDKVDDSYYLSDRIDAWCTRHFLLCLSIGIIIFAILFVILCYTIVGTSAVESGVPYNHLQTIV